ncbi:MAG: M50 family metallopeptidase [Acutalibacteraceae bacterium]|nr:M50 family metallopeptidase [Acutalibacteraceae bacterium]
MNIRLFDVHFYLSYPFVALVTLLLVFDVKGIVLCCLLASFFHEMGHIFAMKLYGTKVNSIGLSVFDVNITDTGKPNRGFIAEIIITVAGVFVNIVLFLLCCIVYNSFNIYILRCFATANLTLGIFNALPIDSLDGGNALEMILRRNFSDKTVYFVTLLVSVLFVIPLGFISFFILLNSPYNFTFLFATMYLIGVIIFKRKKNF